LHLGHLIEAKNLIDNVGVINQNFQGEFFRLLDWVEYHMVMSRFSLRHWHMNVEPIKGIKNIAPVEEETCLIQKVRLKNMKVHVCTVI
jgi:hypothetical protein